MPANKTPIYQTPQIRELERLAIERFAITSDIMMQRAGKAAFDFLQRRWPNAHQVTIFCGGGNNGGDGYVVARFAHEHHLKVSIWQVGNIDHLSSEAQAAHDACVAANIPIHKFNSHAEIHRTDLVVDAICGIGLHDNLREEAVAAILKMESLHAPIFSIDVPSGVDADTGSILGTAVHATATITFIGLKLGLLTGNGIAYTGELVCHDLQLPSELFTSVEPIAEKIHLNAYAHYLKPRTRDWHKGMSGHVLVVGGTLGFSGAARMAAETALRVGAGLVSVATRPEHAALMNLTCPEIMCHGIADAEQLDPLIEKADVIILGPGLGQSNWAKTLWTKVRRTDLPLLIDADGLNLLAQSPHAHDNWVLTPHPGEAARLLQETTAVVQADRLSAIESIQKQYGGVCVLKGAGTLILAPNSLPALCDKGNPGMASAGMGDVLSGVIAGLIAQGIPLGDAAKLGVCVHAMAGDLAAKEGERGLLAMDLLPYLRRLVNCSSER